MNGILNYKYLDYPFTFLAFFLLIFQFSTNSNSIPLISTIVIISLISRVFQYALLIQSLRKKYSLNISILLTFFISHFTLFTSLYYLNYLLYGSSGFLYSGSPKAGNKLNLENIEEINSKREFDKDIHINLFNYTASTSFLVGHNEISVNTTFGKVINIFNMLDSISLLGFLVSFIYSSLTKKHRF